MKGIHIGEKDHGAAKTAMPMPLLSTTCIRNGRANTER
jgi:hypothetical protein